MTTAATNPYAQAHRPGRWLRQTGRAWLLLALLAVPAVCLAQGGVPASACQGATEAAADEARRRFQAADASLHLTYGRVMEGLTIEARLALRKDQRSWLARRDAQCQAALQTSPGEACAQRDFHACLETLTQGRTAAVQAWPASR